MLVQSVGSLPKTGPVWCGLRSQIGLALTSVSDGSEDGTVTMDASIMDGADGAAGAVVNVRRIRHPIRAANCILKQGWPVMLNSQAADEFAIQNGVEEVEPTWLITELRQKQWNLWKEQNARPGATDEDDSVLDHDLEGMGTVGAVALDKNGFPLLASLLA